VLGASRAASLLIKELVFSGVGRYGGLVIADGDRVELHNLDIMPLPESAIGMPKVEALAGLLYALVPDCNLIPLFGTLSEPAIMSAMACSDVIFSAVDNDAARVGAGHVAVRYHRPHIDVTGGAAFTTEREIAVGGEVRAFVPGRSGCVCCCGNEEPWRVRSELELSAEQEREAREAMDGGGRPGSLGPALMAAVGEALQQFWRLLGGRHATSAWLHYYHEPNGMPVWQDWSDRRRASCKVCARPGYRGAGDPTGGLT